MYLKSIEIRGFKSFADRTLLNFKDGITAVVGPNGSGKSNISDAVRWVLGEQKIKSLRGGKMEDIIFSGTDFRKPLGFAEVTLLLDNSGKSLPIAYQEVSVTRKLYRSGESDYMINNTSCRLRDIQELFMDTGIGKEGYSLIGQGKIEAILSADIPVLGHLGLTPQSVHQFGGYRVQGRGREAADMLLEDALLLEKAGCFALILEGIPLELGAEVSRALRIPTIGIGAGPDCDGQVLVLHDLIGLTFGKPARFVRRYADVAGTIREALKTFGEDVRSGSYPSEAESYAAAPHIAAASWPRTAAAGGPLVQLCTCA